jgi:CheY-like chemotaxis protein
MHTTPILESARVVSASAPVPAAATPAVLPPVVAPHVDASLTPILVADDDPDDRYFITRFIAKTGVKNPVKVFDDGTELVNYLGARLAHATGRHREPQLLFLDLKMHGLGGFGFLEWARQQPGLAALTIVVLSNSAEPADMEKARELGAHRYLVKYPSVQTITTIVRSVHPFTLA